MYLQIIYSLLAIGGFFTFAKAQNRTRFIVRPDLDVPAQPKACPMPTEDTKIELLNSASATGSYPSKEIQNQILAQKLQNTIRNAKLATDFYTSAVSGHGGVPGISLHFVDTCPAVTRYYTIPKAVAHLGKICWVLRPWSQHRIRYATCSIQKCRNVISQKVSGYVLEPYCRSSNWRSYVYYVICPSPWRIYPKFVTLPQCCSCFRLKCG